MIYAFDFDNTLAYTEYPKIIKPRQPILDFAKNLKANGQTIILWTCREGQALADAVNWCKQQGLEFDKVNDNDDERVKIWGNFNRKIYADFYIDDHALDASYLENVLKFSKYYQEIVDKKSNMCYNNNTEEKVCDCWHIEDTWIGKHGVCWGTREKDICDCGGNTKQCDFYEEVRNRT